MAMWSSGLFDSLHKLESSNEDGPKSKLFNVMLMVFKSVPTTINGIDGQSLSCYDYQTGSAVRVAVYFREPVPTGLPMVMIGVHKRKFNDGSMGIAVYENSFTSFGRDNMFVQYAQEWVKLIESPATSLLTYKNISKPVLKSLEELMEEANISKKMEYAAVKLRLATGIDTTTDIGYNACITKLPNGQLCKSMVHQSSSSTTDKYICKNNHENRDWCVMYRISVDCVEPSKPQQTVTMTLFDEGGRSLVACSLDELWEMEEDERNSKLNRLVGYEFVAIVSYKHDKNFVITGVLPEVK